MQYTTIRIEGEILSADILDKIEKGNIKGQTPKDFNLDGKTKVKDEIAKAWADAQDMWRIFKRQMEKTDSYGTSETRRYFVVPLLGLLGYEAELSKGAETVNDKSYAISHRGTNVDGFPIHIMGFNDNLDKKRSEGGPRMSPHALIQEYLNLTEHLFALVTNGFHLRLLRDSSRLIKLSYLEFDLESMMEEQHYADFALMYRLLHVSRMPVKMDMGAESLIEHYHQDALDSGTRIREGLSRAVEDTILSLANGFLSHKDNQDLREEISNGLSQEEFYQYLLRLIYRLLFLMVTEERNLIFPKNCDKKLREIYYSYYSIQRLRNLCEKRYLADKKHSDLWVSMKNTFRIFENEENGKHLTIRPLAGDLFRSDAVGVLGRCSLDNKVLLECLRNLSVFRNFKTGQTMRVNYGSLNVEEFGSVYEGLLEYDPVFLEENGRVQFKFKAGEERSSSGSHYTPDELVKPLITHSLDHVIEGKLKEADKEKALISIKVCDVACGSGHILLNAARRIGYVLAKVRTGEDQPSPNPLRKAIRDVIGNCIYGVDKNPLAIELCKVALWLEAHNPGEPLNFLDHHIKYGDAIVGLAHKEELEDGIANEAFKRLPGDDADVSSRFLRNNKEERKHKFSHLDFDEKVGEPIEDLAKVFSRLNQLPETNVEEINHKKEEYRRLTSGQSYWRIRNLADTLTAQFFIPKTAENEPALVTNSFFQDYLKGTKTLQGKQLETAKQITKEKRFFHWFIEFPEVFAQGGFDCVLGNPPFLGGQKLSGKFGDRFPNYLMKAYEPISSCDLVTYFFRRIFTLIRKNGLQALISTNTIAQGDARKGGLAVIKKIDGRINFAIRSIKWPGRAAVEVSLISIHKGIWRQEHILGNEVVSQISSYLDDSDEVDPYQLKQNKDKSFQGSIILGKGFVLTPEDAQNLIQKKSKNKEVLFPYLNGEDLNNSIDQSPTRWVINFFDWEEGFCRKNFLDCFEIIEQLVKPERLKQKDKIGKALWWRFLRSRGELYQTIAPLERVMVSARVSKHLIFSFSTTECIFSDATVVIAYESYLRFSILMSSFYNEWVRKYSSSLETRLRFSPSDCFINFPFTQNLSHVIESKLEKAGKEYNEFRKEVMQKSQLGLTKTYNQFHNSQLRELTDDDINLIENSTSSESEKKLGKDTVILYKHLKQTEISCSFNEAVESIILLRELHKEMDEAVLEAYGWTDIDLVHAFYEVDYLTENDRVRYTISPKARREILKRLLLLNHEIHEQEVQQGLFKKQNKKASSQKKTITPGENTTLFGTEPTLFNSK